MHDGDDTPTPAADTDVELESLEADLETVDNALQALDSNDFDDAEQLTESLATGGAAASDPAPTDVTPAEG